MKVYGNLVNRVEENKNYNKDKQIHVGDDITMYHWSDRTCYYVTDVINQKNIKVKKYEVVADKSKDCSMGHQNWLLFKSRKECNKYLNSFCKENEHDENPVECPEIELVYRYNKWMEKETYTKEDLDSENMFGAKLRDVFFTEKEIDKLENNKEVYRYQDFGNISFGVRDYFWDWSF